MTAESVLLAWASTIPASLGAWFAAALLLPLFRVRDASVRAAAWTWALLPPALALAGLPSGGLLVFSVVVPEGHPLFRSGIFAPAVLVLWAVVAAALVACRVRRDARLHACVTGLAATSEVPDDLADAVARTARWLGVAPPRVAVWDEDGTAFVAGVRSPVLVVPLQLWRRLDAQGRRAMLLHELSHVRRRDPLRLVVLSYFVDLLWPALALRWTAARLRDAWEAQADEEAVHGGATRTALARSLVEAACASTPRGVLAFGAAHGATVRRLAALRRPPRTVTLALQVAALVWFAPWWPGWGEHVAACRMEGEGDCGARGVVAIGLTGANPFTSMIQNRAAELGYLRRGEPR